MSFSSSRRPPSRAIDATLLTAVYLFEGSALVAALALNRYYNLLDALTARQQTTIAAPVVLAIAAAGYVAVRIIRTHPSDPRALALVATLNVIAILLAFAGGEIMVRVLSVSELTGTRVGSTILLPKDWEDVKARHRELLALVRDDLSYFVVDDRLGWAPGRSRRSKEGLYSTSVEGFRSATSGESYATRSPGPRIVIAGDSFTFGLEVPFESSWGAVLERSLGANTRVLNLGVDGYGVDQAVLRYERDGRPLKPDVAILGFINHDLLRTLSVYSFVTFPEWGLPFNKPRYVLERGELRLLIDRLGSPMDILSAPSITDLPSLDRDPGWNRDEWEHHVYDASYVARFLRSRFRRLPALNVDEQGSEMEQINAALMSRFIRMAMSDGTIPILVYLPARIDFSEENPPARMTTLRTLKSAGLNYIDLRSCVGAVGEERVFVPNRPHYSADGNAAVARCLLPVVQQALRSGNLLLTSDGSRRH